MKSNYYIKYKNIIPKHFFEKKNINILEFGVETGQTTSLFLEMCKNNKGVVFSVDCKNYSELFKYPNWKFINSRDDDFEQIVMKIKDFKFDIICLDTIHTKKHIHIKLLSCQLLIKKTKQITGSSMPILRNSGHLRSKNFAFHHDAYGQEHANEHLQPIKK